MLFKQRADMEWGTVQRNMALILSDGDPVNGVAIWFARERLDLLMYFRKMASCCRDAVDNVFVVGNLGVF